MEGCGNMAFFFFQNGSKSFFRGINKPYYDKNTNKEETRMKKYDGFGIILVIVYIVLLTAMLYLGTIREGQIYVTCNNGVETHWYGKIDVFGNQWITGSRSFYMRSR